MAFDRLVFGVSMKKYYTGIGSRETPEDVQYEMMHWAKKLARLGYTLRSGAADGADTAFEKGTYNNLGIPDSREIYLPWKGFNAESDQRRHMDNNSPLFLDALPADIQKSAEFIAHNHHPYWRNLTIGGKKLHTRNVLQVLGRDLMTPSKFVLCWTKDGLASGGTGQALRIAEAKKIPIYNMNNPFAMELFQQHIFSFYENDHKTVNELIKEKENDKTDRNSTS